VGLIAPVGERVLVERLQEKSYLEDLGGDGRRILK